MNEEISVFHLLTFSKRLLPSDNRKLRFAAYSELSAASLLTHIR